MNPPHKAILRRYDGEIAEAYAEYIHDLKEAGRDERRQISVKAIADGSLAMEKKQAAGRLGAAIGAASKRALRQALFTKIDAERGKGVDITPTVVLHAAERLLRRGVSMRAANAVFGIPGRTAATKSAVSAEDLAELEAQLWGELIALNKQLAIVRGRHRRRWSRSREKRALVMEWQSARQRGSSSSSAVGQED